MHKIIYDCDNTIGIKGKDVDDGLTILYLLGREDVNLLGVTTTHGNSRVEEVYKNTIGMLNELKIKGIPILKGEEKTSSIINQASEFLLKQCKEKPGEITLLATGSMTNLYGAYLQDKNFFKYLKEIVIMGGVLEPLIVSGKNVKELNLSCDAEAAYCVLTSGVKITVINAHTSLQALFSEKEMNFIKEISDNKILSYIYRQTEDWYNLRYTKYGIKGFYNWDAAAAIYITNPELFYEDVKFITPNLEDLGWGYMRESKNKNYGYEINMPSGIKNIEKFNELLVKSWINLNNK